MILYKTPEARLRAELLRPEASVLMGAMALWCRLNGMLFTVTETVSTVPEDQRLNRVSSSHREGRAFDVSIKDWRPDQLALFEATFTSLFGGLGAVSKAGETRLIVVHDNGNGLHAHVQIHTRYRKCE